MTHTRIELALWALLLAAVLGSCASFDTTETPRSDGTSPQPAASAARQSDSAADHTTRTAEKPSEPTRAEAGGFARRSAPDTESVRNALPSTRTLPTPTIPQEDDADGGGRGSGTAAAVRAADRRAALEALAVPTRPAPERGRRAAGSSVLPAPAVPRAENATRATQPPSPAPGAEPARPSQVPPSSAPATSDDTATSRGEDLSAPRAVAQTSDNDAGSDPQSRDTSSGATADGEAAVSPSTADADMSPGKTEPRGLAESPGTAPGAETAASTSSDRERAAETATELPPDRALPGPPPRGSESTPAPAQEREGSKADDTTGSGTDGGGSNAPPETVLRTVSTGLHATTTVDLPGVGWTYLGNTEEVDYERREVQGNATRFTFRPLEPGEHRLLFMRQDLTQGIAEDAEVTLQVEGTASARARSRVPETTPAPSGGSSSSTSSAGDLGTENAHRAGRAPAGSGASDQAAEGPTSGATPAAPEDGTTEDARPEDYRRRNGTGAYQEAAQLVETGRPKEGLNAYLRAYDGDLDAAYDIAVLAEELNETEIATFFWQDTASGTGAAAIEAHRVLFQRSLGDLGELARPSSPPTPQERADDTTREPLPASAGPTTGAAARAFDHFRALERAGQLPVQEARLRLAQALLAQDEPSKAQQVLAADSSSSGAPAELLYLLGRSYEEQKRPSRAIEHYRELMDNYVLSSYYEPARERYEYLRRHFLHVR